MQFREFSREMISEIMKRRIEIYQKLLTYVNEKSLRQIVNILIKEFKLNTLLNLENMKKKISCVSQNYEGLVRWPDIILGNKMIITKCYGKILSVDKMSEDKMIIII